MSSAETEQLLEEIDAALRPSSGEEIGRRASPKGLGVLSVSNGSSLDAVVVLFQGETQRLAFYIRGGESARVEDVAKGAYQIRFMSGSRWSGSEFLRDQSFFEFERAADFTEEDRGDRIVYSEIQLTLQPVLGGNTRTAPTEPFGLSIPLQKR